MRRIVLLLALFGTLLLTGCAGGGGGSSSGSGQRQFPLSSLQRATLTVNGQTLSVYVMDTEAKREEGMMFLADADLGVNEGMLFVFPDSTVRSFWMKNTAIPLDIAFTDAAGTVVSTAVMAPYDLTPVSSHEPASFALEVKQGTLTRVGIHLGEVLTLPSGVHAAN